MVNTWKKLGMHIILATAVAPAQAGQLDGPGSTAQEPDKAAAIARQLEDLTKALNKLVEQLRDSETTNNVRAARSQKDLEELRGQIALLRKDLDELRNRSTASQPSTAFYAPGTAPTGRLRLINTYTVPVSFIVNDQVSYPVAPGETRFTNPLPAGTFTYEVLGVGFGSIQSRVSRALAANETFTIHVHPVR
jgi:hypothetical protein